MVKAVVNGAQNTEFNLSFNDIIGHVPGRKGRGNAQKGTYEDATGKILVVYSKNPALVEIPARQDGKKTNRTGLTRIGMFVVSAVGKFAGQARLVTCDKLADGEKKWKASKKTLTIGGNPHVVPAPTGQVQADLETFDDEEE